MTTTARLAVAAAALLLASGCAVEWANRQPAAELAQQANRPPGSLYAGWRVYQDRCARCHGADAAGSANAPDLRQRLQGMGARRFVGLVLTRYDWGLPADEATAARIEKREQGTLTMPAWQGEPVVTAHIMDLYAYLAARAAGTVGAGRPAE